MRARRSKIAKCLPNQTFPCFCFDSTAQKYYHAPLMSAPAVIDSLEFVRNGGEIHETVPVAEFGRLHDLLYDGAGEIAYTLRGGHDERQRPRLRLSVSGSVRLRCQRCLNALPLPLTLSANLLLVQPGTMDASEDEDPLAPDSIEASPSLDVRGLVEDEIILSLPFSPRHAEEACRAPADEAGRPATKESPFAKLASLKKI